MCKCVKCVSVYSPTVYLAVVGGGGKRLLPSLVPLFTHTDTHRRTQRERSGSGASSRTFEFEIGEIKCFPVALCPVFLCWGVKSADRSSARRSDCGCWDRRSVGSDGTGWGGGTSTLKCTVNCYFFAFNVSMRTVSVCDNLPHPTPWKISRKWSGRRPEVGRK